MARKHDSLKYRERIVALVISVRSKTLVSKEFGLAHQTNRNWLHEALEEEVCFRINEHPNHFRRYLEEFRQRYNQAQPYWAIRPGKVRIRGLQRGL